MIRVRTARSDDAGAWLAMRLTLWPEESAEDLRTEVERFRVEGSRTNEGVVVVRCFRKAL